MTLQQSLLTRLRYQAQPSCHLHPPGGARCLRGRVLVRLLVRAGRPAGTRLRHPAQPLKPATPGSVSKGCSTSLLPLYVQCCHVPA